MRSLNLPSSSSRSLLRYLLAGLSTNDFRQPETVRNIGPRASHPNGERVRIANLQPLGAVRPAHGGTLEVQKAHPLSSGLPTPRT
jgi:hypothetical protein